MKEIQPFNTVERAVLKEMLQTFDMWVIRIAWEKKSLPFSSHCGMSKYVISKVVALHMNNLVRDSSQFQKG